MKKYDRSFHTKRENRLDQYTCMAKEVLRIKPDCKQILDIGCSNGALLYGIQKVNPSIMCAGLDFSVNLNDLIFVGVYIDHNLTQGVKTITKADIINCQEVIEHVDAKYEGDIIKTITTNSKKGTALIFSGAIEGQKGRNHINCRSLIYWQCLLQEQGWQLDKQATATYSKNTKESGIVPKHYYNNTMVFTQTREGNDL